MNDRLSRLERKHDAETKALAARCDRLERELTAMRETPKRGEQSTKEAVQRPHPPQDNSLSRSFSGKDLETMTKGVDSLKHWTDKARATIVYDSKVDRFTSEGYSPKSRTNQLSRSLVTQTTATLSLFAAVQQWRPSNNQLILKSRFQVFSGKAQRGQDWKLETACKNAEPDLSKVRDFSEIFHVVVTQVILESYFYFGIPWPNNQ